jgi:hypothetical protein
VRISGPKKAKVTEPTKNAVWTHNLYSSSNKKTPWSEFASELYRLRDRRLSAKSLPTFVDRGCHVVSVTSLWPYSRFSRQEPLLFYQVAPQLYS